MESPQHITGKYFCVKERDKWLWRTVFILKTVLPRIKKQVDKPGCKVNFSSMFKGKNQVPLILTGLLFVCAIVAAIGAISYYTASNELRNLQVEAARMEGRRNLTRVLAAEAMEYSKRNPSIDPILQSVGLKPTTASPKASK